MRDLYFLVLLPPAPLARDIDEIRHQLWHRFNAQKVLNSPPHITLVPPFEYAHRDELLQRLHEFSFSGKSISIRCNGFGHFGHRTIFVEVDQNAELIDFQERLKDYCQRALGLKSPASGRDFHPHITLATGDLKQAQFKPAWEFVKTHSIHQEFDTTGFHLLRHTGKRWLLDKFFTFGT